MNIDLAWSAWRKSSYSGQQGNCVEVAQAAWRKSSHSGPEQNCVEVADRQSALIGVRDSKDPDGPALVFASPVWRGFMAAVKGGEFDRL